MTKNDDIMDFLIDDDEIVELESAYKYKVIIVDDDESVHQVTKFALDKFDFEGVSLEFYDAYSGEEAIELMKNLEDVSIILLDMVMESELSGLEVVKKVRKQFNNSMTRIILRTGQPGQAPEKEIICQYDINDYKTKIELTTQKLYTTVYTAIRSYRDIKIIEFQRLGFKKIIEASNNLYHFNSLKDFLKRMLEQLNILINYNVKDIVIWEDNIILDSMLLTKEDDDYFVLAGTGEFKKHEGENGLEFSREIEKLLIDNDMTNTNDFIKIEEKFIFASYNSKLNSKKYFYMKVERALHNHELLKMFLYNSALIVDNYMVHKRSLNEQKRMILKMGQIMEGKDFNTYYHMNRVSQIAKLLALELGVGVYMACNIEIGASLHDVGKIVIPDEILNKPGRLTEDEFISMQKHCSAGFELFSASNLDITNIASEITLGHHEKYDGTGYPRGLKGEEIPLSARIAAVADVFDALSHDRVYKKAWTIDETYSYIINKSGKQFDPKVVKVLVDNKESVTQISEKFRYR